MIVAGLDLGLDGALALVDSTGVRDVLDLPTCEVRVGKRLRREHSPALALDLLRKVAAHGVGLVAVEWLHPMPIGEGPGSGALANHSLGVAKGVYLTACAAAGLSVQRVYPQSWRKAFGLLSGKEAGRARALELFPCASHWLARKKDHGRADAILIAEYARRKFDGSPAA